MAAVAETSDDELERVLDEAARLMKASLEGGRPRRAVYRRAGRPCPRCGTAVSSRGQGDDNRIAYWCPAVSRSELARIAELPLPARVAVDGVDAAGKTTLADRLAARCRTLSD